jgi:hypothetical protein
MLIEIKKISDLIFKKLKEVYKCIEEINPCLKVDIINGILFRKIYGETLLHSDGISDKQFMYSDLHFIKENQMNEKVLARSITNIFCLNEDYEGGEFEISNPNPNPLKHINTKFKDKFTTGTLISFPSFVWHKVHKVTNGTRKVLVGWAVGSQ